MASMIAIWSATLLMTITHSSAQRLPINYNSSQICRGMYCNSLDALMRLEQCIMIRGNLTIALFENPRYEEIFRKKQIGPYPLREITGYLVIYRVIGLESLGHLFPNLTRIRGEDVLTNFGLIVYDMPTLKEVGLYNLLKIDRGGVIIGGGVETCHVSTIDWNAIAPKARRVLNRTAKKGTCPKYNCSNCTFCWSKSKCQRFTEGPEAEDCHEQCLGCWNEDSTECSVCRHYTYRGKCVSSCPADSLILQINKYCLSVAECNYLGGFPWNNSCNFMCPIGYKRVDPLTIKGKPNCEQCDNCGETCSSQFITTIDSIQGASRCAFINGSLTIHVRFIPEAMEELRRYLGRIEEVRDYILVYGSYTITSLDFLSSLKIIGGVKLKNGVHSLLVYNMQRLETLFTDKVTKSLKIGNGDMGVYKNPLLCMSEINKIKGLFPIKTDVMKEGVLNGYSGVCEEASVGLSVRVKNDTSALARFMSVNNPQVQYSLLYARVPKTKSSKIVPEVCSESEWFAVDVFPDDFLNTSIASIELRNLQPASTYAACIETYDPVQKILARSVIINFSTAVGKPAPPFITELVANSSDRVFIHWVDHKDYKNHITHHELNVALIDIDPKDALTRNHCKYYGNYDDEVETLKYSRHAVITIPPPEYEIPCEYKCHLMAFVNITEGALEEHSFDICSNSGKDHHNYCDTDVVETEKNSTVGNLVKTLSLKIAQNQTNYLISGLAPYRDYRFSLRACTKTDCSRYVRGVARTYISDDADQVNVTSASADESGFLQIQWEPPSVSNGVVLSYYVLVEPSLVYDYVPVAECVLSDHLSLTVRSIKARKYRVRVCSLSLGSTACGDWKEVIVHTRPTWWWTGILIGVLLCGFSIVVTIFWKPRNNNNDSMMLLDSAFIYSDSEPPSFMMSDFAPMYNIPLDDPPELYF